MVLVGHLDQIVAAEVVVADGAEDVVDDRGRHLDVRVAVDHALRLEAGEGEGVDELLQRHAVLQTLRDGDGETVHQRTHRRALFVEVDEDLAEGAVVIFAGAQVELVTGDPGFLGHATTASRKLAADWPEAINVRRQRARFVGMPAAGSLGDDFVDPSSSSSLASDLDESGWLSFEPSR